jgi:DNA-binding transcriptional MerR regulator
MSDRKVNKKQKALTFEMPEIPNKLYFGIGEVAKICDLKPHVLRYWENEFEKLAPMKRRGNRRYYSPADIRLIMTIKHLLYCDGFTIEGARAQLKHRQITAPEPTHYQEAVATPKAKLKELPEEKKIPLINQPVEKPTIAHALADLERALDLFEEKDLV